jgi:hypothetical protein
MNSGAQKCKRRLLLMTTEAALCEEIVIACPESSSAIHIDCI